MATNLGPCTIDIGEALDGWYILVTTAPTFIKVVAVVL